MQRFSGRPSGLGSDAVPKFFSLAKQLAQKRNARQEVAPKNTPSKPFLTTSKQKEAEISKTIAKSYLPSGLKLAKLRQLAAQHKILGQQSRDFLHRSEAGQRVQGTAGLKKFETELIEAESEALEQEHIHDPRKFEYRKEADHPDRLAKKLVKGLYHDAAEQVHETNSKAAVLAERRAHHEMVKSILDRGSAAQTNGPATAPTTAPAKTTLHFEQPTPLTINSSARGNAMAPMSGGGHITQAAAAEDPTSPSVILGVPVTTSAESPTMTPSSIEPATSSEPANSVSAPVDVQLPDMSHLSDPFGGEE